MNIKKGDLVAVITGRDKGKQGKVLRSLPSEGRLVVEGINLRKRHKKPSQALPKGGIIEFSAPMDRSNVMPVSPQDGKPTRVRMFVAEDGTKRRTCARTGASLDI